MKDTAAVFKAGLIVILLIVLGYFGHEAYLIVDGNGYIPHLYDMDLYFAGEWLPSETRTCRVYAGEPGAAAVLDCPATNGQQNPVRHRVPITFFGHPELGEDEWVCLRKAEAFSCERR